MDGTPFSVSGSSKLIGAMDLSNAVAIGEIIAKKRDEDIITGEAAARHGSGTVRQETVGNLSLATGPMPVIDTFDITQTMAWKERDYTSVASGGYIQFSDGSFLCQGKLATWSLAACPSVSTSPSSIGAQTFTLPSGAQPVIDPYGMTKEEFGAFIEQHTKQLGKVVCGQWSTNTPFVETKCSPGLIVIRVDP